MASGDKIYLATQETVNTKLNKEEVFSYIAPTENNLYRGVLFNYTPDQTIGSLQIKKRSTTKVNSDSISTLDPFGTDYTRFNSNRFNTSDKLFYPVIRIAPNDKYGGIYTDASENYLGGITYIHNLYVKYITLDSETEYLKTMYSYDLNIKYSNFYTFEDDITILDLQKPLEQIGQCGLYNISLRFFDNSLITFKALVLNAAYHIVEEITDIYYGVSSDYKSSASLTQDTSNKSLIHINGFDAPPDILIIEKCC